MQGRKPVVFIHGLFMNPVCWDQWVKFFNRKGYDCYTPAYPFHEGIPQQLRSVTDTRLGKLTFGQVLDYLSDYVDSIPEKPILIGHSVGGLLVQKLLERKKGVAGVSIASAAPPGIFSWKWTFIRSNFPVLNPFRGNSPMTPSVSWYHSSVCNTMTYDEAALAREKFVVPESRNILRTLQRVDYSKCDKPLLFISAEKDNVTPAELNKKNFLAYKKSSASTEYKKFKGTSHFICWQKNWEEVADFALHWIERQLPVTRLEFEPAEDELLFV